MTKLRLGTIFNEQYLDLAEARKDKLYSMIPVFFPSLVEDSKNNWDKIPKLFLRKDYLNLINDVDLNFRFQNKKGLSDNKKKEAAKLLDKVKKDIAEKVPATNQRKEDLKRVSSLKIESKNDAIVAEKLHNLLKNKWLLDSIVESIEKNNYIPNIQKSEKDILKILDSHQDFLPLLKIPNHFPITKIPQFIPQIMHKNDLLDISAFLEYLTKKVAKPEMPPSLTKKQLSVLIKEDLDYGNLSLRKKIEYTRALIYLNPFLFVKGLGEDTGHVSKKINTALTNTAIDAYYSKHFKTITATTVILAAISLGVYSNREAIKNTYTETNAHFKSIDKSISVFVGDNYTKLNKWLEKSIADLTDDLPSKKTPETASKQPKKTYENKTSQPQSTLPMSEILQPESKTQSKPIVSIYPEGMKIEYVSTNQENAGLNARALPFLSIVEDSINKIITVKIDETKMNSNKGLDDLTIKLGEQHKGYKLSCIYFMKEGSDRHINYILK